MSKKSVSWYCLVLAVVTALVAGCGGGGGGGTSPGPAPTVSGVAAAGAPLFGSVYLKDSLGQELPPVPLATDGSFSINLTGLTAPFILKAVGSASGTPYTLYSVATGPGVCNLNPLSNLALAAAQGNDNLASLYALSGGPLTAALQAVKTALPTAIASVRTALQPTLTKFGVSGVNFVTDPFVANHQGLDLFFDMVAITIGGGNVTLVDRTNNNLTTTKGLITFLADSVDLVPGGLVSGSVFVTPAAPSVPTGSTLAFTAVVIGASSPVTWTVDEGDAGGTITSGGVYTAPSTAGTYHVRATSAADANKSATATVTILDTNVLALVPTGTQGVYTLQGIGLVDIQGVDFIISYNTSQLGRPVVSLAQGMPGGLQATNATVAGVVRWAYVSMTPTSGNVPVATITFRDVIGTPTTPTLTTYSIVQ